MCTLRAWARPCAVGNVLSAPTWETRWLWSPWCSSLRAARYTLSVLHPRKLTIAHIAAHMFSSRASLVTWCKRSPVMAQDSEDGSGLWTHTRARTVWLTTASSLSARWGCTLAGQQARKRFHRSEPPRLSLNLAHYALSARSAPTASLILAHYLFQHDKYPTTPPPLSFHVYYRNI